MTENTAEEPIAVAAAPTVSQPAVVVPVTKQSHTRTILEVVGGVVAVFLIFFSGAAGFVLGHVTAKHDDDNGPHRGITMSIERGEGFGGGPRPDFRQGPSDPQGTSPLAPPG